MKYLSNMCIFFMINAINIYIFSQCVNSTKLKNVCNKYYICEHLFAIMVAV